MSIDNRAYLYQYRKGTFWAIAGNGKVNQNSVPPQFRILRWRRKTDDYRHMDTGVF